MKTGFYGYLQLVNQGREIINTIKVLMKKLWISLV